MASSNDGTTINGNREYESPDIFESTIMTFPLLPPKKGKP
jgi:hypothetical protein